MNGILGADQTVPAEMAVVAGILAIPQENAWESYQSKYNIPLACPAKKLYSVQIFEEKHGIK